MIVRRRCSCGSEEFYARQQCWSTIKVDSFGQWVETIDTEDCTHPYGPFECSCGKSYSEFHDIPEENSNKEE